MDYNQAAICLQKIWRGQKTRKELLLTLEWYTDVLNEIDDKNYKIKNIFLPKSSKYSVLRRPLLLTNQSIFHAPLKDVSVLEVTYSDDFENDSSSNSGNTELLHSTAKLENKDVDVINVTVNNTDTSLETNEHTSIDSNNLSLKADELSHTNTSVNKEDIIKSLLDKRRDITMELLWVQQAIDSRRNYLQVKQQISAN